MILAIGIDPSKGIAAWDVEGKRFVFIETTTFWGIIGTLSTRKKMGSPMTVYVEAAHNISHVWHRGENMRAQAAIGKRVGANNREGELIVEWCKMAGIEVKEITPRKGGWTKLDAPFFERLTGWKERTSEHGRDAAMLVYGR